MHDDLDDFIEAWLGKEARMPLVSTADKLKAIKRELALRRNVYRKEVKQGKKTEQEAAREIAIMEAIAADYEREAKQIEITIRAEGD